MIQSPFLSTPVNDPADRYLALDWFLALSGLAWGVWLLVPSLYYNDLNPTLPSAFSYIATLIDQRTIGASATVLGCLKIASAVQGVRTSTVAIVAACWWAFICWGLLMANRSSSGAVHHASSVIANIVIAWKMWNRDINLIAGVDA